MSTRVSVDLRTLVAPLSLSLPQLTTVVELLDAGNTVPFITRYRKDQTGGLDEEQIRAVQTRVNQLRLMAERKQTILRSIESQAKLTPELEAAILAADSSRQLEDLYLPYKPKKRSLATLARERGLEILAREILAADPACGDLDARAADFVDPDKKIKSPADALLGAGHILAEQFSERADFRQKLRAIVERTGTLVSVRAEGEPRGEEPKSTPPVAAADPAPSATEVGPTEADASAPAGGEPTEETADEHPLGDEHSIADEHSLGDEQSEPDLADASDADETAAELDEPTSEEPTSDELESDEPASEELASDETGDDSESELVVEAPAADEALTSAASPSDQAAGAPVAAGENAEGTSPTGHESPSPTPAPSRPAAAVANRKAPPRGGPAADLKKQQEIEQRFRDYFNYRESIGRVPPHRVLAINRGERARVLRVKVEVDQAACERVVDELLVPADHPHADFLRGCGRDALVRLVLPSLERELRRELTDRSEAHAVEVFARNLRHLLLQPPVRGKRLLAIDPGFRSGCKLALLDEFGNVLDHGVMHIVGKQERRTAGRAKLVELVDKHQPQVIAIGNGTACRQSEELIAELLTGEWAERGIAYVIVNEAGASVYSASRLGREELPGYDATLRGTVSIGRRLQDPLSELVKIDPPSIGVGLYQHDVKAKHLRESLDAEIESCVNFVGVDVNTASPALLRYVSGLNQLTARRVYDYRVEHGPFRNRNQLQDVPGLGEAGFTQAAGFLKIGDGDSPLDATWIHPESYPLASRLLDKLGFQAADLLAKEKLAELAERATQVDAAALAAELEVGEFTLRDTLAQLARPGRDPREDLPPPIFKRGVLKLEDLSVGMELTGTVLNVVDFGVFVDIGLNDSGLVHISQLADRYVPNPHEVCAVGDIVKVWVLSIDKARRRVSLTMIDPAIRRAAEERRQQWEDHRRQQQERRAARAQRPPVAAEGVAAAPAGGGAPATGGGGRPPRGGKFEGGPRRGRPGGYGGQGGHGGRGGGQSGGTVQTHDRPPQRKERSRPPVDVKLTKEMEEGKAYLNTFGQLKKLLELRDQPPPPPVPPTPPSPQPPSTPTDG